MTAEAPAQDAVVERDGFTWAAAGEDGADDNDLGYEPHEAVLEPVLRELLGAGGVFLDVGAHVGRWTVRLAGRARKVIAVEPHPGTAAVLRRNVELNGLANVTVIEAAAWDGAGPLKLEDPLGRERSGTNRTLPDGEGAVRGQRLDDLLADEQEISLVKIDTEGADLHVLRGMSSLLERRRPVMVVERHDFLGYYSAADLFRTLSGLGYTWRDGPLYAGYPHLICTPAEPLTAPGQQ